MSQIFSLISAYPIPFTVVVVTLILVAVAAFYSGLTVKRYEIETDRLADGSYLRIVHLSDLHSCRWGKSQKKLLTNVEQLMPDVIFMTGDNVDDLRKRDAAYELVDGLQKLKVPTFLVAGNHELRIDDLDVVYSKLRESGIEILDLTQKKIRINGNLITVAGTGDPLIYDDADEYTKSFSDAFSDIESTTGLRLLLAHRPEKWRLYAACSFDAAFSGHAHGGQVRIPGILNGLYAPHQGLFPKRAGGLYVNDGFVHSVSRGLSVFWDLPRIFNPPEIVLCVFKGIKPSKKNK